MFKVLDSANASATCRDDRRGAILRTATRLWGNAGYHAVSLRRIADEAAVTPSLVDHHFRTKINLFAHAISGFSEACSEARQDLQPTYSNVVIEPLTIETIAAGMFRPIKLLDANGESGQDVLRLFQTHWFDPTPELRWHLERTFADLCIVVVDMLSMVSPRESVASLQTISQLGFLGAISIVVESTARAAGARTPHADASEPPSVASAERFIVAAMRSTATPAAPTQRIADLTTRGCAAR